MREIALLGCTPEPLMSYLKALGLFRLVAEQKDPSAKLCWRNGVAILQSHFDRDELIRFFLEEYQPTPVLAPWNGGSGFYGGGAEPLNAISESTLPRLTLYRESIKRIRNFIPSVKPKDDDKKDLLIECRSWLADEVTPWLDTCFVLGEDGPSYFPLLGTGANDGRLDFTNNFMQRLAEVIPFSDDEKRPKQSAESLSDALFGDTLVLLDSAAIGQFNPGWIGGANGTQGRFEAGSLVNPWEYVLMIEGAMLFAGSISRRMGMSGSSRAVFPFTVESIAVGYGSATASEETTDGSRAETWLPLWESASTLHEIQHLFAEGRAQIGRRQAKNAVEFALAANLLGVSSGVTSFVRYGFLKRNGLAFLATPLGVQQVKLRPTARLLEDPPLVDWIDRLRRATNDKEKTPSRYQSVLRQFDRAMFTFANRSEQGNDAPYLLDIIRAVGRAEKALAKGLRFCKEKDLRPLARLSEEWLTQADDGSIEFRLAASLAGIQHSRNKKIGPIRVYLEEVKTAPYPYWSPGCTSAVWSNRPLADNLAAVFRRRQLEAFREGIAGVPLYSSQFARLDDVIAFLNEETDDDKLSDLLWGLIGVETPSEKTFHNQNAIRVDIPFEFGVPRLLVNEAQFTFNSEFNRWKYSEAEPNANPDPDVFHQLASGRRDDVKQCVTRAARRLKSGGLLVNGYRNRATSGGVVDTVSCFSPVRLLAAMLFPLSHSDIERIANSVLFPPESED